MYRKQRPSVALACVIVTVCLSTWAINEAFGKPTTTDENLSTTSQDDSLPPDTFRKLAQALYQRGEKAENRLQRKFFYNDTVMCNDRSTAGYYIRRNFKSKKWIIFLEGKKEQIGFGIYYLWNSKNHFGEKLQVVHLLKFQLINIQTIGTLCSKIFEKC